MKKILSLLLVGVMVFSMIPAAYATTDYTNGTQVSYNAEDPDGDGVTNNKEEYTVVVPASLAPGGSGDVTASGTWASNRQLNVTLKEETVTLTNSISGGDQKVLDLTFENIALVGSNIAAVSETKPVSVASMDAAALFGTWEGVFEYNVEMVDVLTLLYLGYGSEPLYESTAGNYVFTGLSLDTPSREEWLGSKVVFCDGTNPEIEVCTIDSSMISQEFGAFSKDSDAGYYVCLDDGIALGIIFEGGTDSFGTYSSGIQAIAHSESGSVFSQITAIEGAYFKIIK